jgi:predicted nuclease of restriction endonuclease-like (RecB) superfamily
MKKKMTISIPDEKNLEILSDIRKLIESARGRTATYINAEITQLYWKVGERIHREILKEKRAEYGAEIVPTLSAQLVQDYGNKFEVKNLWRMMQFAAYFSKEEIVVTLSRQLSWSHFIEIIPVKDQLAREFYAEMCRIERWSVRILRKKIDSMMFERTAIAKKPDMVIKMELASLRKGDKLTPDLVFRDPYFLDFLGLKGSFQEKDLETAILRELESFIMELGVGFTFVERQKRMIVDGDDFYLDLLFYHRNLRRLVAIELKLDKFKPDFKGQMELYLRWLDKYERKGGEDQPIGLILCAGKSDERIELLELSKSGIHVAEYITKLLPKDVLMKKFHEAIRRARMRIDNITKEE